MYLNSMSSVLSLIVIKKHFHYSITQFQPVLLTSASDCLSVSIYKLNELLTYVCMFSTDTLS